MESSREYINLNIFSDTIMIFLGKWARIAFYFKLPILLIMILSITVGYFLNMPMSSNTSTVSTKNDLLNISIGKIERDIVIIKKDIVRIRDTRADNKYRNINYKNVGVNLNPYVETVQDNEYGLWVFGERHIYKHNGNEITITAHSYIDDVLMETVGVGIGVEVKIHGRYKLFDVLCVSGVKEDDMHTWISKGMRKAIKYRENVIKKLNGQDFELVKEAVCE